MTLVHNELPAEVSADTRAVRSVSGHQVATAESYKVGISRTEACPFCRQSVDAFQWLSRLSPAKRHDLNISALVASLHAVVHGLRGVRALQKEVLRRAGNSQNDEKPSSRRSRISLKDSQQSSCASTTVPSAQTLVGRTNIFADVQRSLLARHERQHPDSSESNTKTACTSGFEWRRTSHNVFLRSPETAEKQSQKSRTLVQFSAGASTDQNTILSEAEAGRCSLESICAVKQREEVGCCLAGLGKQVLTSQYLLQVDEVLSCVCTSNQRASDSHKELVKLELRLLWAQLLLAAIQQRLTQISVEHGGSSAIVVADANCSRNTCNKELVPLAANTDLKTKTEERASDGIFTAAEVDWTEEGARMLAAVDVMLTHTAVVFGSYHRPQFEKSFDSLLGEVLFVIEELVRILSGTSSIDQLRTRPHPLEINSIRESNVMNRFPINNQDTSEIFQQLLSSRQRVLVFRCFPRLPEITHALALLLVAVARPPQALAAVAVSASDAAARCQYEHVLHQRLQHLHELVETCFISEAHKTAHFYSNEPAPHNSAVDMIAANSCFHAGEAGVDTIAFDGLALETAPEVGDCSSNRKADRSSTRRGSGRECEEGHNPIDYSCGLLLDVDARLFRDLLASACVPPRMTWAEVCPVSSNTDRAKRRERCMCLCEKSLFLCEGRSKPQNFPGLSEYNRLCFSDRIALGPIKTGAVDVMSLKKCVYEAVVATFVYIETTLAPFIDDENPGQMWIEKCAFLSAWYSPAVEAAATKARCALRCVLNTGGQKCNSWLGFLPQQQHMRVVNRFLSMILTSVHVPRTIGQSGPQACRKSLLPLNVAMRVAMAQSGAHIDSFRDSLSGLVAFPDGLAHESIDINQLRLTSREGGTKCDDSQGKTDYLESEGFPFNGTETTIMSIFIIRATLVIVQALQDSNLDAIGTFIIPILLRVFGIHQPVLQYFAWKCLNSAIFLLSCQEAAMFREPLLQALHDSTPVFPEFSDCIPAYVEVFCSVYKVVIPDPMEEEFITGARSLIRMMLLRNDFDSDIFTVFLKHFKDFLRHGGFSLLYILKDIMNIALKAVESINPIAGIEGLRLVRLAVVLFDKYCTCYINDILTRVVMMYLAYVSPSYATRPKCNEAFALAFLCRNAAGKGENTSVYDRSEMESEIFSVVEAVKEILLEEDFKMMMSVLECSCKHKLNVHDCDFCDDLVNFCRMCTQRSMKSTHFVLGQRE